MKRLFLATLILSFSTLPLYSQVSYTPSKAVEQTWLPIFEDSNDSGPLANFRLKLQYESASPGILSLENLGGIDLPAGEHTLLLTHEQTDDNPATVSATLNGKEHVSKESKVQAGGQVMQSDEPALSLSGDFTVSVHFQTKGGGTLFAKCAREGKWSRDAKALFVRDGKLVYDIGWLGSLQGGKRVNDGKIHHAVLIVSDGNAELYLDQKSIGQEKGLSSPDKAGHVFKVGLGASDFTKELTKGGVENLRYWARAIEGEERKLLIAGKLDEVNTPDLNFNPESAASTFLNPKGYPGITTTLTLPEDLKIKSASIQALEVAGHRNLIAGWNGETMKQGQQIYQTLCVTCHGAPGKEGSLPTALKFHEGEFKNGSDPYRMYQTLHQGFGMMVPQPQYNAEQKYAVIQYIREAFLKPHNPGQYFEVTEAYLELLPEKLKSVKEAAPVSPGNAKPFEKMDFGPALFWTYQVDKEKDILKSNIAQKGISIRLDKGPGGISKGNSWMVYDEDTMRVAAAYRGSFVDWRGIAFDGSHGTHTSIAGEADLVNPNTPAWKNPVTGSWDDTRVVGRDGRKFGPLSRDWIHYRGTYIHGEDVVIRYNVGDAEILEQPGIINYGEKPVFTRTLNVKKSPHDLVTLLAPADDGTAIALTAPEGVELKKDTTGTFLHIPASATPANLTVGISRADQATVDSITPEAADLTPLTKGGPARFGETVIKTAGVPGEVENGFAVDTLTIPNLEQNPWNSWMRLGGFDFFPENPDRAAVCTWMGDVWLVDGVAGNLSELKWRRICSGLFQPLGLKIVDGKIYVTCRDQIAKLHDFNSDEEIDYIESFNNDHQVTEHFHEFAMGLQTDDKGNFYYAKSARHAKKAVVPHHGTLLRVSPDGSTTEIVATGFRAANGVCLNPDGTWIVTDQEGHWNPKNRINYVKEGGFYGNMYGYHDVTDDSDSAMEKPLCWITNNFDRSPAELLWVPENAKWGSLNGVLLNLSYGYGMVYTVPHEVINGQAQGGMSKLPIANLPTGIHRGRFHPENGQLYGVGMFAWAGSQRGDGGFFRIRSTGEPSFLPTVIEARKGQLTITFTDELPADATCEIKTWDLKRTASYGSKHYNEKGLEVSKVTVDGTKMVLGIPGLAPTRGMEIKCKLGEGIERIIHNSIHVLPEPQ